MNSNDGVVFSELYLPRPLAPAAVGQFITRLASDQDAARVVFEARGEQEGVRFLLGCRPTDMHRIRKLLADFIPGALLNGLSRSRLAMVTARRLVLRPSGRTQPTPATRRTAWCPRNDSRWSSLR